MLSPDDQALNGAIHHPNAYPEQHQRYHEDEAPVSQHIPAPADRSLGLGSPLYPEYQPIGSDQHQWTQFPAANYSSPEPSPHQNIYSRPEPHLDHGAFDVDLVPDQPLAGTLTNPILDYAPQFPGIDSADPQADWKLHDQIYTSSAPYFIQPSDKFAMAAAGSNGVPGSYNPDGFFIPTNSLDIPEELIRVPTGSSVIDTESVVGDFGRTYHGYKEGKYLLPNDAAEQDRLDFQYAAFTILMGGRLFFAPLDDPKHALDVATGTGIWAMDFADKFPNCQIIGTDLSSIQPSNAPSNITFLKDDAEEEWLFPNKFDYVHLRLVFTCFNDPKKLIQEAFKSLNSGGWMEFQDPDAATLLSIDGDTTHLAFKKLLDTVVVGAKILVGRDIEVAANYKGWMEEVGFINVTEQRIRLPIGPWSDDPREKLGGRYMQRNFLDGALLAGWRMLKAAGMSEDEAKAIIAEAKADVLNSENRVYCVLRVVYGQKP
ncbi:S-adenosyl-L-methionine-dependent methyltransferase [Xylariales sp. PMI_506]|nr:S-adenosyl-L-methionine-dependent methyltransferase [Xylariales sp. PMI_506]